MLSLPTQYSHSTNIRDDKRSNYHESVQTESGEKHTNNTSSVYSSLSKQNVYIWKVILELRRIITFYYLHYITAGVNAANMFGMGWVDAAVED